MKQRKFKTYTTEFKQSSAKLAAESEKSITQTAHDLGVNVNTLHGWVNKYAIKQEVQSAHEPSLYEEVKQLRKENARLKQEHDILKKAAAYFASEI